MTPLVIAGVFRFFPVFFKTALSVNRNYDLLETSRGPEARQREGSLGVSVFLIVSGACWSVWRKKKKFFCRYSGYIKAVRSKIAKRCRREAPKPSRRVIIERLQMPPRYYPTHLTRQHLLIFRTFHVDFSMAQQS